MRLDTPVTFAFRLRERLTTPAATGSPTSVNTMGMVCVAALAVERGRLAAREDHVDAGLDQAAAAVEHLLGTSIRELDVEDDVATFLEPRLRRPALSPSTAG